MNMRPASIRRFVKQRRILALTHFLYCSVMTLASAHDRSIPWRSGSVLRKTAGPVFRIRIGRHDLDRAVKHGLRQISRRGCLKDL
jgi:hypothetical protein